MIERATKPNATESSTQKFRPAGTGPINSRKSGERISSRYTAIQNAPCAVGFRIGMGAILAKNLVCRKPAHQPRGCVSTR